MKMKIRLLRASSLLAILGALILLIGCDMLEMIDEQTNYLNESTGSCTVTYPLAPDEDNHAVAIREPKIITALQAGEMMLQDGVLILDVRTLEEFQGGHIENAVLLPYNEIFVLAESVILDRSITILVYCRTGRRSNVAAWLLHELGFMYVYDFGGILDWHGAIVTG